MTLINWLGQKSFTLQINNYISLHLRPLVWMCCFRKSNNLINNIYWRTLKLINQDNSSFEMLLQRQQEYSTRLFDSPKELKTLMTEI